MFVRVAQEQDYDAIMDLIDISLDTYVSNFLEKEIIVDLKKFYDKKTFG